MPSCTCKSAIVRCYLNAAFATADTALSVSDNARSLVSNGDYDVVLYGGLTVVQPESS